MAEEEFSTGDLFQDPDGFYPEEAQPTFAEHQMLSGETVRVRLVGSHPLYVWLYHMQKTCIYPPNGKIWESRTFNLTFLIGQSALECWPDKLTLYRGAYRPVDSGQGRSRDRRGCGCSEYRERHSRCAYSGHDRLS